MLTVALYAQVLANGRMQDYFRYSLGRSEMFSAEFSLAKIFNVPAIAGWFIRLQRWLRDVAIGRGMTTSKWMDRLHLVASRDPAVFNADCAVIPSREFLRLVADEQSDSGFPGAPVCWALIVNDSDRLAVQLKSDRGR